MTSNPQAAGRAVGVGVDCDLVARAALIASAAEIAALRKCPGRLGDVAVGPGLLKHADEQTVVGLAAVLKAAGGGLDPAGFGAWGVVAAPRFLGRATFDRAFPQFLAEGAWGVSPLLISSHSLHSVSGAVSQALKAHGPNLGVGGASGGEEQALLAAAVWLAEGSAPGVWVVLTGWNPGWDGAGDGGSPGVCEALALALTAPRPGWAGPKMVIAPGLAGAGPGKTRFEPGRPGTPGPHAVKAATVERPAARSGGGAGHGD